jgi:spectinomycin phosphotransferase
MMEKPDLADEALAAHVRDDYGLEVSGVEFLPLGADVDAAAYRVVVAAGYGVGMYGSGGRGPYFLKLRRGPANDPRARLQAFLAAAGSTCVLAPQSALDGMLTTQIGEFSAILYPFVEGRSGSDVDLTDDQWFVLGSALRAVHGVQLPTVLRKALRVEDYGARWRERVRVHLARSASVQARTHTSDAAAKELVEVLAARREHIATIVARAEQLAARMREKPRPQVLCHGDIHAGNVMVANDGSIAVVDWDEPVLAPRERDLMFIGGGVGGVWGAAPEYTARYEEFYRGYGPAPVDAEAIAYYRYERIVEDVAVCCDQLLLSTEGGEDRALGLRFFLDQFRPGDVVEIADVTFSTV